MKIEKLKSWEGHEFSSGSYNGTDFLQFAKDYKAFLDEVAKDIGAILIISKPSHYCLSRFIEKDGKYVYGNTSDVRGSKQRMDNILIRTAKNEKDFAGGANRYADVDNLKEKIEQLLSE